MKDSSVAALLQSEKNPALRRIGEKVLAGERILPEEGIILFENGSLPFLGALANFVREKLHGDKTYFNRNFPYHQPFGNINAQLTTYRLTHRIFQRYFQFWHNRNLC